MGYKKFYPVDKNDPRVWANQIKILMEERGITQQKLASESGVPSTTISEWIGKSKKSETGFREPGITRFHKVAKALGVSMDYLLGEKECETSVYKGYKQDKIEMRGDRAEMSDFPLYLNTVAGGLDRRDQTIGGFSFVVKIYAVPVVEIIG